MYSCMLGPTWGDVNQVQELRKQAAELGLETKGTKAELLARVEKYLREQGVALFTPH